MREIMYINPGEKKRGEKKGKSMPEKKKKSPPKKRPAKNPAKGKKLAKKAARSVAKSFMGLNFGKALKDAPMIQVGMFASTWAAKRFGPAASQTDPASWEWSSYLKGAAGGTVAAMLANAVKRGSGQKVLEGALNIMIFKALQNEVIAGSDWATAQFGEAEDWTDLSQDEYIPTEYLLTGTDDEPYAYDDEGNMYPADDRHRLPEVSGGVLEPPGPLGNDALEPVGPLGRDPWARTFLE